MRTFDGNLNAYHALNKLMDSKVKEFSRRISETTTLEEQKDIVNESYQYFSGQRRLYGELGEEMAKIMSKHWWEFWE